MFFKEERLKSKLINNLDSIIKSINNGDFDKIFSEKILPLKLYEDYSKEVEEILTQLSHIKNHQFLMCKSFIKPINRHFLI